MRKLVFILLPALIFIALSNLVNGQSLDNLKIIVIRHAEKPEKGLNLTCQGLNRSLQLPKVLNEKFGIPAYIFVPSLGLGETTKHARMFQTITPFAVKYNLQINSAHDEKDSLLIASDLKAHRGTMLLVWEHKSIPPVVRALGVNAPALVWPDNDYDSIWIITFKNGNAVLTKDKEGLSPSADCSF